MPFRAGDHLSKHALAVSFLSFDGFDVLCLLDALLGLPEIPLVLQRKKEYYGRQCFHRLSTGISAALSKDFGPPLLLSSARPHHARLFLGPDTLERCLHRPDVLIGAGDDGCATRADEVVVSQRRSAGNDRASPCSRLRRSPRYQGGHCGAYSGTDQY